MELNYTDCLIVVRYNKVSPELVIVEKEVVQSIG
jgi:hypothetical protein